VVPFFGVESYLAECLDSLREQAFADFEAILVDDGSLDASLAIAEKYAAEDPRFRIVRQPNQGLGPARNTGVRHASGEYLAFVDSDDVVPPQAYARMVGTLDHTGSDMVSGNARRFNDLGVRDSALHRRPFAADRLATHVREFPLLALDRMAWNKVYRRGYWDKHGFAFPPGLYEDYPVTIRSHVLARQVDVLAHPVYYWRERDGGDLSITQRVWEISNLRDRVASDESVLDFLRDRAAELLPEVERHLLQVDVAALAAAVHRNDPADRDDVVALSQRLLGRISGPVLQRASPFDRVQADLVRRGLLSELERLIDYRAVHGTKAPITRRGGRLRPQFFRTLPFFEDPAVGVPDDCYRVARDELILAGMVVDTWWEETTVVLHLRLGVGQAPLDAGPAKVWLVAPSGTSLRLEAEECGRCADRVDLRVRVEADRLAETGWWRLEAESRALGVRARGRLRTELSARARWSAAREVGRGTWVKPANNQGYGLLVSRPADCVTEVAVDGSTLVISGWFTPGERARAGEPPAIWLRIRDGGDVVAGLTELLAREPGDPPGTARFSTRVDAAGIASHGREDRITERTVWAARLATGIEAPRGVLLPPQPGAVSVTVGGRRVSVVSGQFGNLTLHEEYAHPVVHSVEFGVATLRLVGRVDRAGARPEAARLRRYLPSAEPLILDLPLEWTEEPATSSEPPGAGPVFGCEVPVSALEEMAGAIAVHEVEDEGGGPTPWDVLMLDSTTGGGEPVVLDVNAVHLVPGSMTVAGFSVSVVLGRMARLGLRVAQQQASATKT